MDDAGQVEVLDAAEHLVEKVGHPLMVQVHVDHLVMYTFRNESLAFYEIHSSCL